MIGSLHSITLFLERPSQVVNKNHETFFVFCFKECLPIMELLNISHYWQINAQDETDIINQKECSKKFVRQGRSHFEARSVLTVREHRKMARTPLAAFFNIPRKKDLQFLLATGTHS